MNLFFVFIFLIFSSILSIESQAQGFIPGPNLEYDFSQFDWEVFSDPENVQEHIDSRRQTLEYVGPAGIILGLNIGKLDLVRLELELDLYKEGIKRGLSDYEIQQAEEAIRRHWENIRDIEAQIRGYAGLGVARAGDLEATIQGLQLGAIDAAGDYRKDVWELYKGDHEVLFNMVEKTDKKLFSALDSNDEAYARMILPQVEEYTKKMGGLTQSYYNSLKSAYQQDKLNLGRDDIQILIDAHDNSFQIYKCFLKNFKNPEGEHQQALKGVIQDWHASQSFWGADSMIEAYKKGIESNPLFVASELHKFISAPEEVKGMIAKFYRNDILNNQEFINTENRYKLGARVDALIGLKYFGLLNNEEEDLFERAISAGIIEKVGKGNVYFGYNRPIP
ncbi:MAG: hypothetical protein OXJ52_07100 [Oligoflexia bacterium]|nr:hypothetical protein [Oligoflexia bacterium]